MSIKYQVKRILRSNHRLFNQVRKELDWFIHDRLSFSILFILPLFIVILIGAGAFSITEITGTPTVYFLDLDNTEYSRNFIESYRTSSYFNMTVYDNHQNPERVTLESCESEIKTELLDAYIIIPENYTYNLIEYRNATIYLIIDAESENSQIVLSYFQQGNIIYQTEYQVFNSEIVYNPIFRPENAFDFIQMVLPVLIPLLLFVCANLIASQSVIGDEPLKRMLSTPARRIEIIFAKMISYSILSIVLAFLTIFILNVIFQMDFYSFVNTFIITAAIPIFGVSFGLFFSTLSTSKLQAAQLSLFSFIVQFVLVLFIRIEILVDILPVEIIRKLFMQVAFRGTPLAEIWIEIIKILGYNFGILIFATLLYRRKKYDV